jgi:hypothetical protein
MMAKTHHDSNQTSIYVCLGITFAAAIITTGMRLTARRITKILLWWDDYLGVLAFVRGYELILYHFTSNTFLGFRGCMVRPRSLV